VKLRLRIGPHSTVACVTFRGCLSGVVPGYMTTFAYMQSLYFREKAGFEVTVLTMNTRAATLFEGIANNAILIANGVTEIDPLPDTDLQAFCLPCFRTTPRTSPHT